MNAATRQRIVMAAMELFWAKGYQSTSIADILARTQVHSGSLYHFFPGKQHLLVAVLEAYRDGIEEWLLAPAWTGVEDPRERIFALLNGYRTQLLATGFAYGCPIGNLALELHEPDPEIRDLLAANFSNWVSAIERCLIAMDDRIAPGTDRRQLAEFILTIMEGAIMQARTHQDIGLFDRNVAVLRAHLDTLETTRRASVKGGEE